MMYNLAVKTLVVASALSLATVSGASASDVVTLPLQKPCSYNGLIQLNQQIYYSGDKLALSLVLPEELKALLREDAEAHILVYFPDGQIEPFSVVTDGQLLEATIESTALAAGNYQLALVFTQAGGDAIQIKDWYNGFAGLISFNQLQISDKMPGAAPEDNDGDGVIDNNTDNGKMEAINTVSVCAPQEALKPASKTEQVSKLRKKMSHGTVLSHSIETYETHLASMGVDLSLNSAVMFAMRMLYQIRIYVGEYYADRGEFPSSLEELQIEGIEELNPAVAHLTLHPADKASSEAFYYQVTLDSESKGIDSALAQKTIRFTYEPTTHKWYCGPGNPNGLDTQYLPISCRH